MATTIQIKVGNVTATRTFSNDQKAGAVFKKTFELQRLGDVDTATNQQILDGVLDWWLRITKAGPVADYVSSNRAGAEATLETQATSTYDFANT